MVTSLAIQENSSIEDSQPNLNPQTHRGNNGIIARIAVFFIALFVTFVPIQGADSNKLGSLSEADLFLRLNGYTAMNVDQLENLVKAHHLEVYWAGPMVGAKYTLDTSERDRISVRYLGNSQSINDPAVGYRVISTYKGSDSYQMVLHAGEGDGAVQSTNKNGSLVVYYEEYPNNLYMAFKDKDVQVEVYDGRPGMALSLATGHEMIRPI